MYAYLCLCSASLSQWSLYCGLDFRWWTGKISLFGREFYQQLYAYMHEYIHTKCVECIPAFAQCKSLSMQFVLWSWFQVLDGENFITGREFHQQVSNTVFLMKQSGFKPGDRVIITGALTTTSYCIIFAVLAAGEFQQITCTRNL